MVDNDGSVRSYNIVETILQENKVNNPQHY